MRCVFIFLLMMSVAFSGSSRFASENILLYRTANLLSYLGYYYAQAETASNDMEQITKFYETAANLGDFDSLAELGNIYYFGELVERDCEIAQRYYDEAMSKGSPFSFRIMGLHFSAEKPFCEKRDYAQAIKYFEKGAALGDTISMNQAASIHKWGYTGKIDGLKAIEYYEMAAAEWGGSSLTEIGDMYYFGQAVPQDYSRAIEYYERAAARSDTMAMERLADFYIFGRGVPQDLARAEEYLAEAALSEGYGFMSAIKLGGMYYQGDVFPQNYKLAMKYYEFAYSSFSKVGFTYLSFGEEALAHMGIMHYLGQGTPVDYHKAKEYFKEGKEEGSFVAQRYLGIMYLLGRGVKQDLDLSLEYLNESANHTDKESIVILGRLYLGGAYGIKRDPVLAKHYFGWACDSGIQEGCDKYRDLNMQGY